MVENRERWRQIYLPGMVLKAINHKKEEEEELKNVGYGGVQDIEVPRNTNRFLRVTLWLSKFGNLLSKVSNSGLRTKKKVTSIVK